MPPPPFGQQASKKPLHEERRHVTLAFAPPSHLSGRLGPAGIGTAAANELPVAGLHRASPSATLDKSGQSLLIQLSQWPLFRPVLATIVNPRGRYVKYFFATAGSLVGNTPP